MNDQPQSQQSPQQPPFVDSIGLLLLADGNIGFSRGPADPKDKLAIFGLLKLAMDVWATMPVQPPQPAITPANGWLPPPIQKRMKP